MHINPHKLIALAGAMPDILAQETPRAVERVGIIGANATSLGMVVSLLDADVPVTLFDPGRDSIDGLVAQARTGYGAAVARGELAPHARDRRMALLAGSVNFHHLKDCDLIVDTASSDAAAAEKLFRRLDQVAKPDAILATLASHVNVDHIARCTRRSGDVLGLNDAWKALPGRDTSESTLNTVLALARKLHENAALDGDRLAS